MRLGQLLWCSHMHIDQLLWCSHILIGQLWFFVPETTLSRSPIPPHSPSPTLSPLPVVVPLGKITNTQTFFRHLCSRWPFYLWILLVLNPPMNELFMPPFKQPNVDFRVTTWRTSCSLRDWPLPDSDDYTKMVQFKQK